MRDALRAALALAPAPNGFTVAEFTAKVHALTGHDHTGYSVRQAAYDLRKLRGKQLVDKPGTDPPLPRPAHPPRAPSPPCSPCAIRSSPRSSPAVRSPRMGRKPAHWTRVDRDYERIRIDMQTLFSDLAIETPLAA